MKKDDYVYSETELFLSEITRKSLKKFKFKEKDKFTISLLMFLMLFGLMFNFENIILKLLFGGFASLMLMIVAYNIYEIFRFKLIMKRESSVFLVDYENIMGYGKVFYITNMQFTGKSIQLENVVLSKEEVSELAKILVKVFGQERSVELMSETLNSGEYSFYDAIILLSDYRNDFESYEIKMKKEKSTLFAKKIINNIS